MTDENKDKPVNKGGRPKGSKQSHRRLGANRLKRLVTALEPLADQSIITAAEIMNDDSQTGATRLKAAMHLLQKYTELTGEVFFEQLPKDEKESKGSSGSSEEDDEEKEYEEKDGKLSFFSQKKA